MLLALCSNVMMMDTRYKLFKTFCVSVYVSQLWDFKSKQCDRFYTAWLKCIRKLIRMPYQTHSNLLHLICNDLPVDTHLQITRYCLQAQTIIQNVGEDPDGIKRNTMRSRYLKNFWL